ncbi:MAG: hypothetical protein R3244_12925, partial [Thermoanaerobaculia bacterium]|nr:hypothetical protein [Thermoanaerobaculia bacterium]
MPDRWLPVGYLLFAHLCLLAAFLVAAVSPRSLGGFYYHPKLIAVVHLVTLGWLTSSILGALYLILPMALRSPLPARPADRWGFWLFVVGTLGMVSHFWIAEPSGMVWSALLVVAAIGRVGWRTLSALSRAPAPDEHRLPFFLAFANMLLAALLGMAIGIDKSIDILPGFTLHHVYAHAHLAVLGWVTFMVMGASYRLLPMMLPAAVPRGGDLTASAVTAEIGLLWLTTALAAGSDWAGPAALLYLAGLALFLRRLLWMRSHPKPAPKQLVRPDFGVLHLTAALAYLIAAIAVGMALLWAPGAPHGALAMVYGVLGLVGFLSQMVAGVSVRLLPLFAWLRQFAASGFVEIPPSPHAIVHRPLHRLAFWLWMVGPAILAFGLARPDAAATRLGGLILA